MYNVHHIIDYFAQLIVSDFVLRVSMWQPIRVQLCFHSGKIILLNENVWLQKCRCKFLEWRLNLFPKAGLYNSPNKMQRLKPTTIDQIINALSCNTEWRMNKKTCIYSIYAIHRISYINKFALWYQNKCVCVRVHSACACHSIYELITKSRCYGWCCGFSLLWHRCRVADTSVSTGCYTMMMHDVWCMIECRCNKHFRI